MPLLEVIHIKKLTATIQIDEPIAHTLDKYAHHIHASADEVIGKALEFVFSRDKDFQKWAASDAAASVKPSLRLKQTPGARTTKTAAKKPTPIAAQR
jgi:class 3 adenylate cyclase